MTRNDDATGVVLSLIVGYALIVAPAAGASPEKPILFEFWHVGDDVLSERLAVEVDKAFELSPGFTLSEGKKQGTLIVTIPENVDWKPVSTRLRVLYKVTFATATDHVFRTRKGSCWEDALSECAAKIVNEARIAARKGSHR